jgi:hypothetical protein
MFRATARRAFTTSSFLAKEGSPLVLVSRLPADSARLLVASVARLVTAVAGLAVPDAELPSKVKLVVGPAALVLTVAGGVTLATSLTMNWSMRSSPSFFSRLLVMLTTTASIGMSASTVA